MSSSKHNPTPEQEAEWEQQRAMFYQRWRNNLLERCARFVELARNDYDRGRRMKHVRKNMGKNPDKFMKDLADLLYERRSKGV